MNVKDSSGIGEAAARCGVVRKGCSMKEKLTNIWLSIVAIAFSVAAICTFLAWVVGLTICLMRLVNG